MVRRKCSAVRDLLLRHGAAGGGGTASAVVEGVFCQRTGHGLFPASSDVRRRASGGFPDAVDGRELYRGSRKAARAAAAKGGAEPPFQFAAERLVGTSDTRPDDGNHEGIQEERPGAQVP